MSGDIRYVVNAERLLLATSEQAWDRFAVENDARDLIPFPESRSVLDYIGDRTLRRVYVELLESIAEHPRRPVVIPYRCDGPEMTRNAVLKASAIACAGSVLGVFFESHVTGERRRRKRAGCLSRFRTVHEDWPEVEYCSHCGKIRAHQVKTGWVDLDEYYAARGGDEVRVAQAVCRSCVMLIRDRITT